VNRDEMRDELVEVIDLAHDPFRRFDAEAFADAVMDKVWPEIEGSPR
jgi:predicted metal-dependent TIM-barrel fold hydrolase